MSQSPDSSTSTAASFGREYKQCAEGLYVWMHLQLQPTLHQRLAADDLIQEAWCRAYQARERFDPQKGSFKSWLFGIAENVLVEELRRLARRPTPVGQLSSSLSAAPSQLAADLTSISERAARSEFAQCLLEIAEGLPDDERQILLFRGVEELSFEEVGQRVGASAEAARSRWRRIRERCRDALQRHNITLAGLR